MPHYQFCLELPEEYTGSARDAASLHELRKTIGDALKNLSDAELLESVSRLAVTCSKESRLEHSNDDTGCKKYLFDIKCFSSVEVCARSESEARTLVRANIQDGTTNFGVWPNGQPIIVDTVVDDDVLPCDIEFED